MITIRYFLFITTFLFLGQSVYGQGNWLRSIGGGSNEEIRDATVDSNGDLVMAGFFTGSVNTGVGTLASAGNTDIMVIKTNDAGDPIWAVQAGGSGVDRANSIASDAAGNTYITGYFQTSANFGVIPVSGTGWEAYVAKIDVNGNFVWVTTFGGNMGDIGHGIDVDNNGNIICVGEYQGTATFGPDVLVSQINPFTSAPSIDIFVTKLDPSGNFVWTVDGKAKFDDKAFSVSTDNSGNVYVIGQFSDTLTFQNTHNTTLLNAGFLVSFDANGNELWFDKMWGTQVLLTDVQWQSNNVYITGDYNSNLLVEDINNTQNYVGVEQYNVFASRFSSSGDLSWLTSNYSVNEVHSNALTLDASNNVYIAGDFKCTFTEMNQTYGDATFLSVGFEDVHYIKYSSAGSFQWARQMASDQADIGTAIVIKNPDFPIVAGTHEGTIYVPAGSTFNFLAGQQFDLVTTNCGDSNYGNYAKESSSGQRDVFWTSPFDIARLPLDFFEKDPGVSCDLDAHIHCIGDILSFATCDDTLEGCAPITAVLNEFMVVNPHPLYITSWSNGGSAPTTNIDVSGDYSVTLFSADGCYNWIDSVYVDIYPDPSPPEITDSWGYNTNEPPMANGIDTCETDSVYVWANSTGPPTDSIAWYNGGIPQNDSTILVVESGDYAAVTINEFGCVSDTNFIEIIIHDFAIHDTLNPIIQFYDSSIDSTDSVTVCEMPFCSGAFLYDSAYTNIWGTLPGLTALWYLDGLLLDSILIDPKDTTLGDLEDIAEFCVTDVGWHDLTVHLINECGDSVDYFLADSFYVDTLVNPYLVVNVPPACPGDTIIISANYFTDTVYWTSPDIIDNYGDSILVFYDNNNGIDVTVLVDTTVAGLTCETDLIISLPEIPIAQLQLNPPDGIICPGDSVLITATGGTQWQWISPTGDSLGTDQTQWATDVGEYFCYVTTGACSIASEFISTVAYSSPQLVSTNPTFCEGDSAMLQVLGPTNTLITWYAPLTGSDSIQWVNSNGTYYVETTFCGITNVDSITVQISEPLAAFSLAPDTTICPYDTLVLTAPAGMNQYVWNGQAGLQSYEVVDTGIYYLFVEDPFGCTDESDTVHVGYHTLPNPPLALDTTICPGEDATLWAVGTGTMDWYTFTGTHIITSPTLDLFNVPNPVNYLVTASDAFCASIPDTATISFYPDNVLASFNITDQCGSLVVSVQNTGSPGVSYNWDMGDATTYTGPNVTHTYAGNGTYTITLITNDPICGYADTATGVVTVYGQSVTILSNEPTCYLFSDGSLTLNLVNGVGGETFLIEDSLGNQLNVGGTNTANNLPAGWYYWEVELGPGCTLIDSVEIVGPGELLAGISIYPPLCYGFTGSAVVDTVLNWQGDYNNISFFWNPNPAGIGGVWADSAYNMPAGDYVLTINDDFGCSNIIDFTIVQPDPLVFSQLGSDPAYCRLFDVFQIGNGVVFAAASGGTPDYDYLWVNLETGDSSINTTWGGLNPGDYQITVTDNNGCLLIDTVTVDELDPIADFDMSSPDFDVQWEGNAPLEVHFENQSQYYANPNNPNADTTFFWNFNFDQGPWVISHDIGETFDTIYTAGTYTICLVALNKNGCSDTTCKEIIVYDPVLLDPPNIFTPDGDGVNDEFIFLYKSEGIETFHCTVVNRWGVTVREFNDIHEYWDGTDKNTDLCPEGVYFYVYEGAGFNGDQFEGQGTVTLIRGN